MTFDALTMHAVRDELKATLVGGRVDRVLLLGAHALGLTLYAQHRKRALLVSTGPDEARVHLVSTPFKRESEMVTPFLLLLRKHVRGGWVEKIEQPTLERLLTLHIAKRGDDGPVRRVGLIIEAMGRRSNIVLVDEDGTVMDALKRIAPSRNPARPLLPHLRYTPPPGQDRLNPRHESIVARLRDEALAAPDPSPLADLLAQRVAGFSPLLAREVAYRVAGSTGAVATPTTDWSKLSAVLEDLLRPLEDGDWQPTVAMHAGQPMAYAAYPLTHLKEAELRPARSMSEAIEERSRSNSSPQSSPRTGARGTFSPPSNLQPPASSLVVAVSSRQQQLERKRAALERSLVEAEGNDELRAAGEMVLASAASIAPEQETLDWEGRVIKLDPKLSPIENAQRYFREYRKGRDAQRQVPEMIRQIDQELAYLQEMAAFIAIARDPGQLRALRNELAEAGILRSTSPAKRDGRTGRRRPGAQARCLSLPEGFEILVGTSARANDEVTFELAEPGDVWLHARGVPGAHVVIRTHGQEVPESVLQRAAQLAAANSAAAGAGKVAVDWTERRHVRRQRSRTQGRVTYVQEKTLIVTPLE